MKKRKNNIFTEVPVSKVPRNLFDLSHEVKMSGKFGLLYPVLCKEALPGDVFRDQMTAFIRFAPMLAPIMHRVNVTTHFFFVPYRILWPDWEEFITAGQQGVIPEDSPVIPYVQPNSLFSVTRKSFMAQGALWDYLGLPPAPTVDPSAYSNEKIIVFAFQAYQKIWNDWYRDPNLDTEAQLFSDAVGNISAEDDLIELFTMRVRGWEKDYFTSALPWAQRGPEVLMPLAGSGTINWSDVVGQAVWETFAGAPPAVGATSISALGNMVDSAAAGIHPAEGAATVDIDASSVSINDVYRTFALQKWMQNNARGGGRYIEQIESHFNIRVPDYRLQRAEYLGGGKQVVTISEVLATAEGDDVPVGDLAGHGISVGKTNRFTYRCQEHGIVLGIMSVMPNTAYSQGIDRMFTKMDRFDYAFPELAHIGEQPILSREVFFSYDGADDAQNVETFGYTPRFAEYKFANDRIAGDFRTSLNYWHLGRNFLERPVLDSIFTSMYENGSQEQSFRRIFANQDGTDYLWCQLFHRLTIKRPLPYFGVPKIM